MAKKTSFKEKVVTGVTGRTKKQRKSDHVLKAKIKAKQMASFRDEQLRQAETVGKKRAEIQAKRQIEQMQKPQTSGGLMDLGDWGKAKEGFDPMTFGTPTGKKKKKKTPSVADYLKSVPA